MGCRLSSEQFEVHHPLRRLAGNGPPYIIFTSCCSDPFGGKNLIRETETEGG